MKKRCSRLHLLQLHSHKCPDNSVPFYNFSRVQAPLLPFSSLRKRATSPSLCSDQGRPWSLSAWCQSDAGTGARPTPEENWGGGEGERERQDKDGGGKREENRPQRETKKRWWERIKQAGIAVTWRSPPTDKTPLTFCPLRALICGENRETQKDG